MANQSANPKWSRPLIVGLFVALACCELGPLVLQQGQPLHSIIWNSLIYHTFLCSSLLCAFVVYALYIPRRNTELAFVLLIGLVLEAGFFALRCPNLGLSISLVHVGSGLGLLALLAMLKRCYIDKQTEQEGLLSIALAMPITLMVSNTVGTFSATHPTKVYDYILYSLDYLTGVQPSFILARIGTANPIIVWTLCLVYFWLPMAMGLSQLVAYIESRPTRCQPILALLAAGICGQLLYYYVPAVGVRELCGEAFPFGAWPILKSVNLIDAPGHLPRNCMPSLHLTWALITFWCVYYFRPIYKYLGLAFVFFTTLGTFNYGHHYLIDLVIALPFTAAIMASCYQGALPNRYLAPTSAVIMAVCTLGWLTAIKYASDKLLAYGTFTVWGLVLTAIASQGLLYYLNRRSQSLEDAARQSALTRELTTPSQHDI